MEKNTPKDQHDQYVLSEDCLLMASDMEITNTDRGFLLDKAWVHATLSLRDSVERLTDAVRDLKDNDLEEKE